MTDEERHQLAELFREDDRLHAEHAQWMARRNAEREAPMRENDPEGILYRTGPENAPAPATGMDAASSEGELYPPYDDLRKIISQFVVEWTNRKLAARDRRIAKLEKQLGTMREDIEAVEREGIEIVCSGVERRLATLEAENIKLKALLEARNYDRVKRRA
jgi:hypothetical protein